MGIFKSKDSLQWASQEWGSSTEISVPRITDTEHLVVLDVIFKPGKGHSFHIHPRQEEVIYVLSGQVEQWIGNSHQLLNPGDSAFIAPGEVHASFNKTKEDVRILAILGPSIGNDGYELEDAEDPRISS